MAIDLFAGIPVADLARSLEWYERLLGGPPAFFPHEVVFTDPDGNEVSLGGGSG